MSFFQRIRAITLLIVAPFLTITVSFMAWFDMCCVRRSKKKALAFPRFWGVFLCRLAGVTVEFKGLDHIQPDRTYIFAGNHCSQFDIFCFQGFFPYNFRWIAKKELFRIPVFGAAMKKVGYIAIDRSRGRKALKSLEEAARQIAQGDSVLIFPEGTRSQTGRLQEFKTGAIILAIKAGVPVIPLGINGSDTILPKGRLLADSGKIVVNIGKPVPTDHYTAKDKQKLARALHLEVEKLLEPRQRSEVTASFTGENKPG
ncbi:MAG: 1-acyl-sn-glycerol-3-phosphate acyltransferase [Desulfobulbus propionicus]|nr:MAG: 1-acyl-sn-glycerol-3-phosphate acyltransferase [Desulfobulbus propionicus]